MEKAHSTLARSRGSWFGQNFMFGRKDLSSLLFSKLKFVKVESKLTSYKGILNIAHHTCNISILYLYVDFSVTYNACSCRCSEHLKMIG